MLRCRTRLRRSTSACRVDVGLASIDWQMSNSFHAARADELFTPISQSRYTDGMLEMPMAALGSPAFRVASAWSSWARNVETGVMPASLDAHTSLAPIWMVTYCTPRLTAFWAWALRSIISAPDVARL